MKDKPCPKCFCYMIDYHMVFDDGTYNVWYCPNCRHGKRADVPINNKQSKV